MGKEINPKKNEKLPLNYNKNRLPEFQLRFLCVLCDFLTDLERFSVVRGSNGFFSRTTVLALFYESVNRLTETKEIEKKKKQQQQHDNKNKLDKRIKPQTRQKLMQFAPRIFRSLILCFILLYLGSVNGIPHTMCIKRVCPLNQQSDVEFARPVDK